MKKTNTSNARKFLDYTERSLKWIALLFVVLSLAALIYQFIESPATDFIGKLIGTFMDSSEIIVLAFIAGGFWVTIKQLQITNTNARKRLINETFELYQKYLDDIQPLIMEVIDVLKKKSPVTPIEWDLKDFTRSELEGKSSFWYKNFSELDNVDFLKSVNNLNRLEGFAQAVKYGSLDKKLAFDLFATDFAAKVGMIMGMIAYLRQYDTYPFCTNTIELYEEWRTATAELIERFSKPR